MPAQGLLSIPTFLHPKGLEPFKKNRRKGFTLIELMVTISIIAILSTVGYVTYSNAQSTARDARRRQDLRSMISALELYYQQNNNQFPIRSTSIKSTDTTGAWKLSSFLTNDISQLPADPINDTTYYYLYNSDGTTYHLCAKLEKPQASDSDNGCSSIDTNFNFGIAGSAI